MPVGTVTLMLGDLEGSTRAWQRDPESMPGKLAAWHELIRETVGRCSGVLPLSQGERDGFLAAFDHEGWITDRLRSER